jgi:hypothetical protein
MSDHQEGSRVARIIGSINAGAPIIMTRDAYALPRGYWNPVWARTGVEQAAVLAWEAAR